MIFGFKVWVDGTPTTENWSLDPFYKSWSNGALFTGEPSTENTTDPMVGNLGTFKTANYTIATNPFYTTDPMVGNLGTFKTANYTIATNPFYTTGAMVGNLGTFKTAEHTAYITYTAGAWSGISGKISNSTWFITIFDLGYTTGALSGVLGSMGGSTYTSYGTFVTFTTNAMRGVPGAMGASYRSSYDTYMVMTSGAMSGIKGAMGVASLPTALLPVTYSVWALEYVREGAAGEGTSETQIIYGDHGLAPGDFIVNTARRTKELERGSRVVYDIGWDNNTLPIYDAVTGQIAGDVIWFFRFTDITGMLKPGTFNLTRKGAGQSVLNFDIVTDASFLLNHGQYIKVRATDTKNVSEWVFYGDVTGHSEELVGAKETTLFQSVQCQGLDNVPGRRSINIDYTDGITYGSIVTELVTKYLFQEGIKVGQIDDGAKLLDWWKEDATSIKDVLDECASKSAYQWYVDDDGRLNFLQELVIVPPAPFVVGDWLGFSGLKVTSDSTQYYNKAFVLGGTDESGNPLILGFEDFAESTAHQKRVAGTGVCGQVTKDSSLEESDYKSAEAGSTSSVINITGHKQLVGDVVWNATRNEKRQVSAVNSLNQFTVSPAFSGMTAPSTHAAEVGTNTTNIKITGHGLATGDMVYNATRTVYLFITKVDNDNFTTHAVPGQTNGDSIHTGADTIALFYQANDTLQMMLRKQSIDPTTLSFRTSQRHNPLTKLKVEMPVIGQVGAQFLIEDVKIVDIGRGLSECYYTITATKRNPESFTTQRKPSYQDYWRDR